MVVGWSSEAHHILLSWHFLQGESQNCLHLQNYNLISFLVTKSKNKDTFFYHVCSDFENVQILEDFNQAELFSKQCERLKFNSQKKNKSLILWME